MVLERPDAVVAHHPDDAEAVPGHRVELDPGEAEGAVAEQQADLALGVGDLGADRLAGPGAEAAEGAGVHPAARLVGVDVAAGVADEVAAVADHDRVAVENLRQLRVDPDRVKRRAAVAQLLPLGGPLLILDRPQPLAPGLRCGRRCPRPPRGPRAGSRRRRRPCRGRGGGWRCSWFGAASSRRIFVSSPKLPPKPRRKSIGTPTTRATSAPFSAGAAGAAEGKLVIRREAAAAEAVEEDRDSERLGQRLKLVLAVGPVEAGAGHDRRPLRRGQQRRRLLDAARGTRPRCASGAAGISASASMKTTSSG